MPSSSPSLGPSQFPSGVTSSIPTLENSFTPSASFTETPSKMPSLSPTLESSAKPSQPPSGSPSTFPTFEVSGVPSAAPSKHISVSPTIGYSVEPSQAPSNVHGQSQGPSIIVDTNGGNTDDSPEIGTDIFERANATIEFGDGSRDKEISLFFNISTRETRVTVFEKDCRSLVDTNIVEVMKDFTPRSESHGDLDVIVDIKQDPVMSSTIWSWDEEETHLAHIDLCVRVEVLVENLDGSTFGRNFFDSELAIEIDMSVGFSSASINPARRNYGTDNRSVSGDFSVESCQCNKDWQCTSETIFQGDKLRVCLLSNSSQTMFHSLDSFQLSQALESGGGFLVDLVIDDGNERNELTDVAFDGNRLMVTTEAANFFFINQDAGIVTASGAVTIGFGSTERRSMLRMTIDNKRDLMDEGNTHFDQDISIGLGPSSSAISFDTGLLTALALAIATSVFIL
uniref:Uncharacterized protein n=1 Tax=Attheya septentrionalis TaxID=420275 RepID=A0A7S2U523_9STRA